MTGQRTLSRFIVLPAVFLWLRGLCLVSVADEAWHVKEAPIRFQLRLWIPPTHLTAGYFAQIPDGGILPGALPVVRVVDADGNELKSYALWQSKETGSAIVFEAPASALTVYVYMTDAGRMETWSPASGLTPSPILCADPEHGNLPAARNLARFGSAGWRVDVRANPGHPKAPLSIGGNLSGRPPPCAFYLLAYLETKDPGKTWIAPFSMRGQSEVLIDGQAVVPAKRVDKWGGTGQWMDLARGLHRLDVFSAYDGPEPFSSGQGVMWLAWRTPNATVEELGGKREEGLPLAGTSAWESRVVRQDEIVRSGSCSLQEVRARDGGPVACPVLRDTHAFWFEGESPVLIYRLTALTAGNPNDTQYVWSFDDEAQAKGAELSWLFPGNEERKAVLTATSGQGQSRATYPFYAYSSMPTSMDSPEARTAFRAACLDVFKAYPPGADPTARWSDSYWNNLMRHTEMGQGDALLAHIFTERWDLLRKKLSPDKRERLEDPFILLASRINPESAIKWIERFRKDAAGERQKMLAIKEAEVHMYYLNTLDAARGLVSPLIRERGAVGQWARIRLGDVEFLAGHLNEATRLYGEVQNENRRGDRVDEKAEQPSGGGLARSKKELEAQREARAPRPAAATPRMADDWEISAIREVADSETVKSLIKQGYYQEARAALDRWERLFPLSKISGDYVILDAKFFMAVGHYGRARRLLESYCEQVDASSFIPAAVETLLTCMLTMKESDENLRAFCEKMKKRLEFHPAADKIDSMLNILQGGEGEREATKDTL